MSYNSILQNDSLIVGDYATAQNLGILNHLNVTHIVAVGFRDGHFPKKFKYLTIDIKDDPTEFLLPFFPRAVVFIQKALQSEGVVFAHCVHGQSRSCSIIIAFLMHQYIADRTKSVLKDHIHNIDIDPALLLHYCYRYTSRCRPCIAINPGFMTQLEIYRQMKTIPHPSICSRSSPISSQAHATFRAMKARSEFYECGTVKTFAILDSHSDQIGYVCKKCSSSLFYPDSICLELSQDEIDKLPESEYWSSSKGGLEYQASYLSNKSIYREFEMALHSDVVFKVEPAEWMKNSMMKEDMSVNTHGILSCDCGHKIGYWDFCSKKSLPILLLQNQVEQRVF